FEFVPGNRKAVHHAELLANSATDLIPIRKDDTLKMLVTYSYEGANFFRGYDYVTGWLPGNTIESFPAGVAKKLPMKDDYIFLIHYPPAPVEQTDSSVLYVYKSQRKPDRYLETVELHGAYDIENGPLMIAANTVKTFHAKNTVEADFSVFAILPHAHHLCKRMLAYAVTPAHDTIQLLRINAWDFDWQYTYKFPRYIKLQAGTVVHFFATYDNTNNNPENPYNPPRDIYSSFNANDEMMELFLLGVPYQQGDENQPLKYELE
ncbi:MAG TPA: hypothetical protein VD905_03550, partial [Flavobacteriales bacterium]|nr:hypothetical protein [Flavobacteriales bacterium]